MTGMLGREYIRPDERPCVDSLVKGVNPRIVALAKSRGVVDSDLQDFFYPTIRNLMPNPSTVKDVDGAALLIADAIRDGVGIGMVGDYDVDGATSVAIMQNFLLDVGCAPERVRFYIPQRMTEGYGVNEAGVEKLFDEGCRILLVLDSGTSSNSVLDHASTLGMRSIVVDHHEIPGDWQKPNAFIINPKRDDDASGLDTLCTAGLAIMLCVRIASILRERGVAVPDVMDYMGLAALGTVADLMTLKGLNRAIVRAGLERMHILTGLAGLVLGVKGLKKDDNFPTLDSSDLGFKIGPCVNAGGRINDCNLGSQVLTSENIDDAIAQGVKLAEINKERRVIQDAIEIAAIEKCKDIPDDTKCVVLYDKDWHPGVIGIVASRVKEHTNLPTVIIGTGGKGSGRSAHGFDLGRAFIDAHKAGILIKGGGHKAAGGLTIDPDRVDEFRVFMNEKARDLQKLPNKLDGVIKASDISAAFERSQAMMEPFGMGNRKPLWFVPDVMITNAKWVGGDQAHLSVIFQGDGARVSGIIFSARNNALAGLASMMGKRVSLAVEIKKSDYTGSGASGIDVVIREAFASHGGIGVA